MRQYIYGVDISLVMCVGVHVDGGSACNRRVSMWGGATPEQKGVGRWGVWAEATVCGQTHVGVQTCWHVEDQGWQSVARTNRIFKVWLFEPGDDLRESTGIRAGVDVRVSVHVCASRRMGCMRSVEVAHVHVGACGFLFSPNMACEKVRMHMCVRDPVDFNLCGSVRR